MEDNLNKSLMADENSHTTEEYNAQVIGNKYDAIIVKSDDMPLEEKLEYAKNLILPLFTLSAELIEIEKRLKQYLTEKEENSTSSICTAITILGIFISFFMIGTFDSTWFILIVPAAYFIGKRMKATREEQKVVEAENNYKHQAEPDLKRKDELENELALYRQSDCYSVFCSMIPEDYRDLEIIDTLIKYAKNKRADTLKEALNLYETEMDRKNNMEMQQAQAAMLLKNLENQDKISSQLNESINWTKVNAAALMERSKAARNTAKKLFKD